MSKLPPKTTDAQLARAFQDAMRATTGEIPPSREAIAEQLERSRAIAAQRPERSRGAASSAQRRAVERRRDAAGEATHPETPLDERRGLAIGSRAAKRPGSPASRVRAPRSSKGTPAPGGETSNRKRRRFLASIARAAPRLRLLDWNERIARRARQIGGSATEAERTCAELPRVLAIRVRRAALGIERRGSSWEASRDWSSIYARRCVAYAWAIYRCALPTRRAGFERLAIGVTQGMIAALVKNPQTLDAYSRAGVAGTSTGADGKGCGPLVALERAGVWYAEQPPAEVTPETLIGPSGHAVQHYWISERSCSVLADGAELEIADVEPRTRPRPPFGGRELRELPELDTGPQRPG